MPEVVDSCHDPHIVPKARNKYERLCIAIASVAQRGSILLYAERERKQK